MNGPAKGIMWIGLFLVAMIVVVHWGEYKAVIFGGKTQAQSGFANATPGAPGGPPKPKGTSCPPGYGYYKGKCLPLVSSLQPPLQG